MIAIIIVGYNSRRYLRDCFISIKKSTLRDYKIIFVDNNSLDNSIEFVKKNYPGVIVIKNKENYGFAKANNIGIQKALELGAEYVFLLNPDTTIDKDCLVVLQKQADQKTILQPLILLHKGKKTNLVNTAGGVLHYLGFSYCGHYKEQADKFIQKKEIALASGAGMFIPAKILAKIGFFDENFFMYHEDVDLCWRARVAGYQIKLIPKARVWHQYSFIRNKMKIFYTERNRFIFLFKNLEPKTLLLILPALAINEFLVCLYALINFWFITKLRCYASILSSMSEIIKNRRQINKIRKMRDFQLKNFLKPELHFDEVKITPPRLYNRILGGYWRIISHLV